MEQLLIKCSKIHPSNLISTYNRFNATKIRIDEDGSGAREPISIPQYFSEIVDEYGDFKALAYKDIRNEWQSITYREYHDKVQHFAKVFIKLGLQPRSSVGIIAFNCPEWFITEMAAIHANGIVAGIYTTNSPEAVYHVLNNSNSNIVIVDDSRQMEKVLQIKDKLPDLKAVIQLNGPLDEHLLNNEIGFYTWSELESMNIEEVAEEYKDRLDQIVVNECCCLIYTSGTVGLPKGVMLNHDNILHTIVVVSYRFPNIEKGAESVVSYLPMSHAAAQIFDVFLCMYLAGTVYFADKAALKGSLAVTLREVRPTRFLGIPRIFEKFSDKIMSNLEAVTGLRKIILNWAMNVTIQHHKACMTGQCTESWSYQIAKNFILHNIKVSLGLDKCKFLITGAAPLSLEVKNFLLGLDLRVVEAYGMSECGGCCSIGDYAAPDIDTVGLPLDSVDVNIFNPDSNGHGEICIRGRINFMGYLNEKEKTNEIFDEDGFLHSGDLGYISDRGYLYITGRLKELIITAGGENIPPVHVENLIKAELHGLSYVVLIGDKRKFLTVLVTIKTKIDSTGIPSDDLNSDSLNWMRSLGLSYTKLSEIINSGPCPKVLESIKDGIDRANKHSISRAQNVQKFALLPQDFSVSTGELGPTMKFRRSFITKKYENIIENLYKN